MTTNPKVVGAFLVGFALVAGSYVISNFGRPSVTTSSLYVTASEPPPRVYIEVKDKDANGIEDWREEFVSVTPIIIPAVSSTTVYEEPTTITDQLGVQFFESFLRAKGSGGVGPTKEDVIAGAADRMRQVAADELYNTRDITVIPATPESIRTYANTIAQIAINNNVPQYEDELVIIDRALQLESEEELAKLDPLVAMYRTLRDQTLKTPVPETLVKQHLDLINVYQALYRGLDEMQLAFDDPVVALVRVQRYQDDATGLANALRNMYNALLPHASLFSIDDPAVLFVIFAPNYQ